MALKMVMSSGRRQLLWMLLLSASLVLILVSLTTLMQNRSVSTHWMKEIENVDLWVYPKHPAAAGELLKIRSLDGVEGASSFCQKTVVVTLPSGIKQECILLGIDELVAPRVITQGKLSHLQLDNSIIVDELGIKTGLSYRHRGSKRTFKMGQYIFVGDHKMLIGGLCRLKSSRQKLPVIYTSYNNATRLFDTKNDDLTAYVVKAKSGISLSKLSEKIERMLNVDTKIHQVALADSMHIAKEPSLKTFSSLWMSLIVGCLFYIVSVGTIFFDLDKKIGPMRSLGAPAPVLVVMFGVQAVVSFVSSWLLATFAFTGCRFASQTIVPYFSIERAHYLTAMFCTFLAVFGLMIYRILRMTGRKYVSYRM